jgi:hypothetical protein
MNAEQQYQLSIEDTEHILEVYRQWIPRTLEGDWFPHIKFVEAPKFADFDYYVYLDDELDHQIEVKHRNNTLDRWIHTKVPLRKHSTAEHLMERYGRKTYFVCGFTDCTAVLPLWEEPDEDSTMVARYDRGEDEDLYAMYKVTRFKKISP